MSTLSLILASSSPARKMLLERLQIPFASVSPDIDESRHTDEPIDHMVVRLATEKAQAVAEQHPRAVIIGCDQVAVLNNQVVGKPGNHKTAVKQLKQLRGKKIRFMNGLCVLNSETGRQQNALNIIDVYFRQLTDKAIENYLRKADAYQCAASLKVETLGIALVKKIRSDDPTALIGLPLIHLVNMLKKEGLTAV